MASPDGPFEAPILIGYVHQQDHHHYDDSDTSAKERRPLYPEEVWIDLAAIPAVPPSRTLWPGTLSGPVRGISGVALTPAPGDPYQLESLAGHFLNAVPANYSGRAYQPALVDANGATVPYNPSVWVFDGVRRVVEFKYKTPAELGYALPLSLSYWTYVGGFASGGVGPWHRAADPAAAGQTDVALDPSLPTTPTDVVVFPAASTEYVGPGTEAKFYLVPADGSLRGGAVDGIFWDAAFRGANSVAFGFDTEASGVNSVVSGAGNVASGSNSTVGGGAANTAAGITATVVGGAGHSAPGPLAFIGGGSLHTASGATSTVAGGASNVASGGSSFVGGGDSNAATGAESAAGGGQSNTASGDASFVGGGGFNTAGGAVSVVGGGTNNSASGTNSAVGGGNNNAASGNRSVISGGRDNLAPGPSSSVGGGQSNAATADSAAVGGGQSNTASGDHSAVGGGQNNQAAGAAATVPGGTGNVASGAAAFAAGTTASATHAGAFVWSDSSGPTASTAVDGCTIGAAGGTTVWSDGARTLGVALAANGIVWAAASDRNKKENLAPLDPEATLERVERLPLYEYNLIGAPESECYRGPMAQDWHALFPSTKDPLRIDTMDLDGITLAAVQGLARRLAAESAERRRLAEENADLRRRLDAIARHLGL